MSISRRVETPEIPKSTELFADLREEIVEIVTADTAKSLFFLAFALNP